MNNTGIIDTVHCTNSTGLGFH